MATPKQMPPTLSLHHGRALAARLKTAEDSCRVIDAWLDPPGGIYYQPVAELSEASREKIRAHVREILAGLARIQQDLVLPRQEISQTGLLRAYLSQLWVSLAESRGRYLEGYGAVPAELAEYLDHRMDELESLVGEVRHILESPTGSAKSQPLRKVTDRRR
jgi:hypothetical protein